MSPNDTSPADGNESTADTYGNNPLLRNDNPDVSPLEQEVLDEYTKLLENMNKVSPPLVSPNKLSKESPNPPLTSHNPALHLHKRLGRSTRSHNP